MGYKQRLSTLVAIIAGAFYLFSKYPIDIAHFGFDKKNIKKITYWGSIGALAMVLYNFPYKIIAGEGKISQDFFVETQQGIPFVFPFLITVIIFTPSFPDNTNPFLPWPSLRSGTTA